MLGLAALIGIVGIIVSPIGRFLLALAAYALTNTFVGGFVLIMILVAAGVIR